MHNEEEIKHISKQFHIHGAIQHAETCKIGHINQTYIAEYDQGGNRVKYVLQKINQSVFTQPKKVINNLIRVTNQIRHKLETSGADDVTRRVITLVDSREGGPYYIDAEGDYWRCFVFIEGIKSYEAVENPRQAYQAGKAFGKFQAYMSDLEGERLHETIPQFHNARMRFDRFSEAVSADKYNRTQSAKKEIDFCYASESFVDTLLRALETGAIQERVTHNDTKFNNVLMDIVTDEERCVVDLDTVMPGLVHYDFGDMVRTTTSRTLEDERDLSKVKMEMDLFRELARGYITATSNFLTPEERNLLAFSGKLMTFVIGLRFLTDYLAGDKYFRVHRPGHNLDRAKTQFKLTQSIAEHEEEMKAFIESLSQS